MSLKDDELIGGDERRTVNISQGARLQVGASHQFHIRECVGGEVRGEIRITVTLNENLSAKAVGRATLYEGTSCDTDDEEDNTTFEINAPTNGESSEWHEKLTSDGPGGGDYADIRLTLRVER